MREHFKPKIGIVTLGHRPYWAQFEGLKETLMAKGSAFASYFSEQSEVVDLGFADTVDASFDAVRRCKREDVDALFLVLSTYVTSSTAFPFLRYLPDVPQVLVAIQPLDRLDYQNTTTRMQLENDDCCALPEIAGVYERFGREIPHFIIAASGEKETIRQQVETWERALAAKAAFKYATIGYLGHTYEGMYDMNTDPTAFSRTFGAHVKMLEMCELAEYVETAGPSAIAARIEEIRKSFDIQGPSNDPLTDVVEDQDLEWSARLSVALDTLVENNGLCALAYYYKGENNNLYERIASNLIIGNTLLTSKGIPLAGEADLKTAASLLVMNRVGGGGSFAELHPFDAVDDVILIGHDGPHNIAISDKKPVLRKLKKFHGKAGSGISVEFSIKAGPLSLLSTSLDRNGGIRMIAAEGESLKGEIPQTGNTNTRCRFPFGPEEFLSRWCQAGPTHHLALGTGTHLKEIQLFARMMHIPFTDIATQSI